MRHILLFILLIITGSLVAQAPSSSMGLMNATDVKMPVAGNAAFAQQQSQRWREMRTVDPQNSIAWWNDYVWTERDNLLTQTYKQAQLSSIVTDAARYISNSGVYTLMLFLEGGRKDSSLLNKALQSPDGAAWMYPYAIQYAATHNATAMLQQYCTAYNNAYPMEHGLEGYHRNALMSADSHAVIYSKGLNDIVPMAVLQQVYGFRKDIQLKFYEGKAEKGAYLCLTMGSEVLSQYPDAVYTGLLVRVGGKASSKELETHITQHINLDAIGWPGGGKEMMLLNRNYLPGLLLLHKAYKNKDATKAMELEQIIRRVADKTGMTAEITKLLQQ